MRDGRRLPIKSLMKKLNLTQYDNAAHWQEAGVAPTSVRVPLKQSAGAACTAVVKAGDRVTAGQALGAVPDKALGAIVHAPFAGTIGEVTATHVILNRNAD